MLSASPRRLSALSLPRPRLARGWLPSWVMATLLVYAIAGSTVAADWVPGSQVIVPAAMVAALLMSALALVRRIPWPVALVAGLAAAPVAAYVASSPVLANAHPGDPQAAASLVQV